MKEYFTNKLIKQLNVSLLVRHIGQFWSEVGHSLVSFHKLFYTYKENYFNVQKISQKFLITLKEIY